MKLERLAARDAQAIHRIETSMRTLCERHDIATAALLAFESASHRDRAITAMRRNEALADFLGALCEAGSMSPAGAQPADILERLTTIPGIGKAKAEQIIAVLEAKS